MSTGVVHMYDHDPEMQHIKMKNTCLQDLQLDNPDAAHLLSLPPSFLAAVLPTLEDHSEGVNVVQSTGMDTLRMYVASYYSFCFVILKAMLTLLLP